LAAKVYKNRPQFYQFKFRSFKFTGIFRNFLNKMKKIIANLALFTGILGLQLENQGHETSCSYSHDRLKKPLVDFN